MKKICFIATTSITMNAFIIDVAKYLYRSGDYEVTLICPYDEEFIKKIPDYLEFIPVAMHRGASITGIKSTLDLYRIFRKRKFDIIQYTAPNASLYSALAGFASRIPVRLYCQWGIIYVGKKGLSRWFYKMIERVTCNLSTWIEPDSNSNLEFSRKEGLYDESKSSVVSNGSAKGVNLKTYNYDMKAQWNQEIRQAHNISADDFVVGFVGRVTRDKGINELIQAYKETFGQSNQHKLLLVGSIEDPERLNQELFNWSKRDENVIYAGATDHPEKYYASFDVFVLPSYREGFGSVVIEAEAMGVPVIVTDIPGPIDAIIENKTGETVPKKDVPALSAALMDYYQSPAKLSEYGRNGRQFVEEYFDSEVLYRLILEDRDRLFKRFVTQN